MKYLLLAFLSFLFSCSPTERKNITIGEYILNVPGNFKLIEENGIDSYVGKIKGDGLELGFDYGYYSNSLVKSEKEFIDEGLWYFNANTRFMKPGITYDINNNPKIEVISYRPSTIDDTVNFKNADFIALLKHDSIVFEYPIFIPAKTKEHLIKIDTIQNHLRKIVISKNPQKGMTGIYLRNLSSFNESINSYTALSMSATGLTEREQDTLLKIFSLIRFSTKK